MRHAPSLGRTAGPGGRVGLARVTLLALLALLALLGGSVPTGARRTPPAGAGGTGAPDGRRRRGDRRCA